MCRESCNTPAVRAGVLAVSCHLFTHALRVERIGHQTCARQYDQPPFATHARATSTVLARSMQSSPESVRLLSPRDCDTCQGLRLVLFRTFLLSFSLIVSLKAGERLCALAGSLPVYLTAALEEEPAAKAYTRTLVAPPPLLLFLLPRNAHTHTQKKETGREGGTEYGQTPARRHR